MSDETAENYALGAIVLYSFGALAFLRGEYLHEPPTMLACLCFLLAGGVAQLRSRA